MHTEPFNTGPVYFKNNFEAFTQYVLKVLCYFSFIGMGI